MKNNKVILFLSFLFLFNCATIDVDYVENPANQLPMDSLKIAMGVEPTEYRVDLIREMEVSTEVEIDDDGESEATTEESKKTYSPIGFYINDYLFFDLNYNLGFDVYKYFDDRYDTDFRINHKATCWFKIGSKLEKRDNEVDIKSNLFGLQKRQVFGVSHDKLVIQKGAFDNSAEQVLISDSELVHQPQQLLKKLTSRKIIKTKNGFTVPVLFWKHKVNKVSLDRIEFKNNMDIFIVNNQVVFKQPFLFDLGAKYHYVELNDGIAFYDRLNFGIEIKLYPDQVEVYKNGRLKDIYTAKSQ